LFKITKKSDPPVTDANGFLQADEQGVINRWDIINAIEHAPWTTKQLYAMRAAEKNSRAKQFASFNGWNNSYSYNPGDRHSEYRFIHLIQPLSSNTSTDLQVSPKATSGPSIGVIFTIMTVDLSFPSKSSLIVPSV
jgi:hypothetical protein